MSRTKTNAPRSAAARARRRGTALIETAMAIPLLAAAVVTTMFFGWAMANQQHVKAAARYTSWRHVYGGWPRADGSLADGDDANDIPDDPNHFGLNEMFFRQEAVSVDVDGGGGPTDEIEELVSAANQQSGYAGDFADRLLLNPLPDYGHFAHARRAYVQATFQNDLEAFRKYRGAIHGQHIRDGVEWRRRQADCRHVTREQFLQSLDSQLQNVPSPGDGMAAMVRSLYRNGW